MECQVLDGSPYGATDLVCDHRGALDDANRNPGIRLALPVDVIDYTAHAVAKDEWRFLFPLTSIAESYGIDVYGGKQWGMRLKPVGGLVPWRVPRKFSKSDYLNLKGEGYWEKPFPGAHVDIGGGYRDGTNLYALAWMYMVARPQGVPLDWGSAEFQEKVVYRMVPRASDGSYQWHDSRISGLDKVPLTEAGRYTRRIYTGGKSANEMESQPPRPASPSVLARMRSELYKALDWRNWVRALGP